MSDPQTPPALPDDGERMVPAYDRDELRYSAHIGRYRFAEQLARGARVLDVASGAGYGAAMLASAGAVSVVGVDRSPEAVAYSRFTYGAPNVSFMVGDAQALPLEPAAFDLVVSFETIEHVPDPGAFLSEIRRVLRPGGVLVVSTPNRGVYPPGNPFHVHEFSFEEFEPALRALFPEVAVLGQDRWIADAVMAEDLLELDDPSTARSLPVAKLNARPLARQLLLVAVCSDAPLPALEPSLTLATVSDSEYVQGELARRDVIIERLVWDRDRHEAEARAAGERLAEAQASFDGDRARLGEWMAEKDRLLEDREAEIRRLTSELASVLSSLPGGQTIPVPAADELRTALAELEALRASRAWKVVERYRRGISLLAPEDSGRRRAYERVLGGLRPGGLVRREVGPLAQDAAAPATSFPEAARPTVSIVVPVHDGAAITARCLDALLAHTDGVAYEVVVVDDASADGTASLLTRYGNLRVLTNAENLGFLRSSARGASAARGDYIVFLNNDTEVRSGWLRSLVDVAETDDSVAIVGSKLVYPDGTLQEAGSIIWSDGTGWNYGRGDDPAKPWYTFVREVDYCSGASILVRRSAYEAAGGFDTRFSPAYYEDADLAFAVRRLGFRVVYQPASVVVHHEGASHGTDESSGIKRFQEVNRHTFVEKWADVLQREHLAPGSSPLVASDRRRTRVLIVDHLVPTYDQDFGSKRMHALVKVMTQMGLAVTFLPDNEAAMQPYTSELEQAGVQVLYRPWDMPGMLEELGPHISLCLLSRPQVSWRHLLVLRELAPNAAFVYDTVDLHYLREMRRAAVSGNQATHRQAGTLRELELGLVRSTDAAVAITEEERRLLEREVPGARLYVVGGAHEVRPTARPFDRREGLLFVANFNHPPNVDAATHFVRDVFPRVLQDLPHCVLYLVGSHPSAEVRALAGPQVVVTGWVPDLEPYMDRCRVCVVPLRFGAGLKGKIGESMAFGLPTVSTTIGVEGMDVTDGIELLVADGPERFSEAVVRLYRDGALWQSIASRALAHAAQTYSHEVVRAALADMLADLGIVARVAASSNGRGTRRAGGGAPVPVALGAVAEGGRPPAPSGERARAAPEGG